MSCIGATAGAGLWRGDNTLSGAICGTALEVVILTTNIWTIYRTRRDHRRDADVVPVPEP
ncbi:MAG TPA: YgjV family protein [Rhodocyclaceae bacterium]|nr:YgjV family protein [Rhodocyclaceae bacterium]